MLDISLMRIKERLFEYVFFSLKSDENVVIFKNNCLFKVVRDLVVRCFF